MAVFALVSFGQGVAKYTNDIFEEMGNDKIIVQPRAFGPPGTSDLGFTEHEVKLIEKTSGVDIAVGLSFVYGEVKATEKSRPQAVAVMGLPTDGREAELVKQLLTVEVLKGRYLKNSDKNKVVVGYNYMIDNKVFSRGLGVGDTMHINGQEMKIVGIMNEVGNPEDDKNIYMEEETFKDFYKKDSYSYVYVKANTGTDIDMVAGNIEETLRDERHQKEGQEDFFAQTFQQIMETSGNIILTINGVVFLIAIISIFVAAINITNTMYTSVLERTQEIGIMKAIGATNETIRNIFLVESASIGFLGGVIGVILGAIIAKIGGIIAASAGFSVLQPYFSLWLIVACILGATLISSLAGLLPAIQASKQKPVEALRYE